MLRRLLRVLVAWALVAVWVIQQPRVSGAATVAASISGSKSYQIVAGFGSSEAFGQALALHNDPEPVRNDVLKFPVRHYDRRWADYPPQSDWGDSRIWHHRTNQTPWQSGS